MNDQFMVNAQGKVTIGNNRVTIDDRSISIPRPDGAKWMQDGLVQQDFTVRGFDPPLFDLGKTTTLQVHGNGMLTVSGRDSTGQILSGSWTMVVVIALILLQMLEIPTKFTR